MNLDPNDEPIEPKKPDFRFLSPSQKLKALKEYKTARNRWLKELKKRDAHVIEVDESIEKIKVKKQYRKQKDSTWKAK